MTDDWMSKSADEDEVLWRNEWLSLRQTKGGFTYAHEEKGRGGGVAVLAYRGKPMQIVGRFEECPPHRDGMSLCALTGQLDKEGEPPIDAAVRELQEEAGIIVGSHEMTSLGTVKSGKQTDTEIHMFAVDIGDRDIGKALGDGTRGEEGAYCKWIDYGQAVESKDPLLGTMAARVMRRGLGLVTQV